MAPGLIDERDWKVVVDYAAQIANSFYEDNPAHGKELELREELITYLDCLETKYGFQPSIIATRAHYAEEPEEQLQLYLKAWELSEAMEDKMNCTLIASSIADLVIEELGDLKAGAVWLERLASALKEHWDDGEEETRLRLLAKLR